MATDAGLLNDFPTSPGIETGGGAFNTAIYAIIIMFVLVGLAYLVSKVLNNRKMEDWSKDEFIQAMISAAIVGGLFLLLAPNTGALFVTFNTLIPKGVSVPVWDGLLVNLKPVSADYEFCADSFKGTILCFSYSYLGYLEETVITFSNALLWFNIVIELLASLSFNLILVQITPLAGLSGLAQVTGSILSSLIFLGIIIGVEMALINFISSTALSFFLPIGVVLRCFFATRKVGGLLIAIAVGMYFIFPLTIALNSMSVNNDIEKDFNEISTLFNTTNELNPYNSGKNADEAEWTSFLGTFGTKLSELKKGIIALPQLWMHLLSSLVVQIIFLPALSILITIISIKELAALFGSEVSLGRFEV